MGVLSIFYIPTTHIRGGEKRRDADEVMASSNPQCFLSFKNLIIAIVLVISSSPPSIQDVSFNLQSTESGGGRALLSLKESPGGGNATFECSPSGPCVPCLYSEKNEEKFRCSETGYRIPLKCVEIKDASKEENDKKPQKSRSALENSLGSKEEELLRDASELTTSLKHRRLLDDPSTKGSGRQSYITYRSCIPAVNEEKLSVLGFEGIMMCLLLLSGPVIYIRRKRTAAMSGGGAVRIPTNSRF